MKSILVLITSATALATVGMGFIWLRLSALPYNSEGRYFDEVTGLVYHEQSVEVYALITVALLILTGLGSLMTLKSFRR